MIEETDSLVTEFTSERIAEDSSKDTSSSNSIDSEVKRSRPTSKYKQAGAAKQLLKSS